MSGKCRASSTPHFVGKQGRSFGQRCMCASSPRPSLLSSQSYPESGAETATQPNFSAAQKPQAVGRRRPSLPPFICAPPSMTVRVTSRCVPEPHPDCASLSRPGGFPASLRSPVVSSLNWHCVRSRCSPAGPVCCRVTVSGLVASTVRCQRHPFLHLPDRAGYPV